MITYTLITRRYYGFEEVRDKFNYDTYSTDRDTYYYDSLEEATKAADKFMSENHTDCSYTIQKVIESKVDPEFLVKCKELGKILSDKEFIIMLDNTCLSEAYQAITDSANDLESACNSVNDSTTKTEITSISHDDRFTTNHLCILCSKKHTIEGCSHYG